MRPTLIGIAGGTGAGKTTIARQLADLLHAQNPTLLSLDSFFLPPNQSPTITIDGKEFPNRNHPATIDLPRLLATLDARTGTTILEGHLALHFPELRHRMSLKVFIDLPPDIRALRRLLRDMKSPRGNSATGGDPEWIAHYYLTCARPAHDLYIEPTRHHADLILQGDSPTAARDILAALST